MKISKQKKKKIKKIIEDAVAPYRAEMKHLEKTGVPRCMTCKKDFIKLDDYTWKPSCEHAKNLRLSIG
jgi:hypothetical protein